MNDLNEVPATETPAERVAGNLALNIYEGRIKPDTPVPSPDELMSSFGVLRPTAIAALTRLERAGLLRGDQSGVMYAVTGSSPALAVTAAAAMCSRPAAQAGSAGDGRQHTAALDVLRENFLSAARRAMRGSITEQDHAVVAARKVLVRAGRVADPSRADWPGTVADGIADRRGQTSGAPSPVGRPVPSRRRAASTTGRAPRRSLR
jgi:DNA-binding FadR family transcriptional regulator